MAQDLRSRSEIYRVLVAAGHHFEQLLELAGSLEQRVCICLLLHSCTQPPVNLVLIVTVNAGSKILKMSNDLQWLLIRVCAV